MMTSKKKLNIDVSDIDVSKERLNKLKGKIKDMPEVEINDLVMRMGRVVNAHNQRKALLQNTKLLLKILALAAAVA